jgi:hypothetical protein
MASVRALLCGALLYLSHLAAPAAGPALAEQADGAPGPRCTELTARTMSVMESAPLMKDELATAVMWLRLDAARAADAGDAGLCVEHMTRALALLEGWRDGMAGGGRPEGVSN